MDTINIPAKCLVIAPSNKIFLFEIYFTIDPNKNIALADIFRNMKKKYNCYNYILGVAKYLYADDIYYHIFFESIEKESNKKYNKLASHIINNRYNTDSNDKYTAKCYGNCYILQCDSVCQLYDTDVKTFINAYNIVHYNMEIKDRKYKLVSKNGSFYKFKILK